MVSAPECAPVVSGVWSRWFKIAVINLPSNLASQTTHRYGPNSFKLHRLPMPRPGQVCVLDRPFLLASSVPINCITSSRARTPASHLHPGDVRASTLWVCVELSSSHGRSPQHPHRLPLWQSMTKMQVQVLGLVGTNGIGKSTALKILSGKVKPNLGNFDNIPDWETILAYFRGSELQNYFKRIIEDDLKASLKPQYVDSIPRAVRGPVKDVRSSLWPFLQLYFRERVHSRTGQLRAARMYAYTAFCLMSALDLVHASNMMHTPSSCPSVTACSYALRAGGNDSV